MVMDRITSLVLLKTLVQWVELCGRQKHTCPPCFKNNLPARFAKCASNPKSIARLPACNSGKSFVLKILVAGPSIQRHGLLISCSDAKIRSPKLS